jgi:hypothetical protein
LGKPKIKKWITFYYFENGNKKRGRSLYKEQNANGGFYYSNEEINKKMWV